MDLDERKRPKTAVKLFGWATLKDGARGCGLARVAPAQILRIQPGAKNKGVRNLILQTWFARSRR